QSNRPALAGAGAAFLLGVENELEMKPRLSIRRRKSRSLRASRCKDPHRFGLDRDRYGRTAVPRENRTELGPRAHRLRPVAPGKRAAWSIFDRTYAQASFETAYLGWQRFPGDRC